MSLTLRNGFLSILTSLPLPTLLFSSSGIHSNTFFLFLFNNIKSINNTLLHSPTTAYLLSATTKTLFHFNHHQITFKMQFESDFRFDMDDSFSMCSQSMSCPSATTSFSSASSAYDPFTPTSRRSSPHELTLDFDHSYGNTHRVDLTPPSSSVGKYFFAPVKSEHEQVPFSESLPNTPVKKMENMNFDYEHMLEMNMAHHHQMGSLTPSHSFGMYTLSPEAAMGATSFMMTPTHSLSGSEAADTSSSWSCGANDSPISFFPNKQQQLPNDFEVLDLDRHSQSPIGHYSMHQSSASPNRLRAQRKMMVHEIQRKSTELQRVQIRSSRKQSDKSESAQVDVVRRAMCKCDYPGCHKAFRRNEHLKRHKQT